MFEDGIVVLVETILKFVNKIGIKKIQINIVIKIRNKKESLKVEFIITSIAPIILNYLKTLIHFVPRLS